MRRGLFSFICLTLFLFGLSSPAAAKRVALVIGNDNYAQVTKLEKAVNDAETIGTTLQDMGFVVLRAQNLSRREMNRQLQQFAAQLDAGDEALFFFAGHGVEIAGRNYLLPTDIPAARPGQEDFVTAEAVPVDQVLDTIRRRGTRVSILILDACRDNPFPKKGTRSLGATRGLARMPAPEGTFIMYSAGVGQTALDGLSDSDPNRNSVFTRSLVPLLQTPGVSLVQTARAVRRDVQKLARTISHDQRPAYYDEVTGDFYFAGRGPALHTSPEQDDGKLAELQIELEALKKRLDRKPEPKMDKPRVAVGTFPQTPKPQAGDAYTPVPVKISGSIEVPGQLEKLLAELKSAADKRDLDAVLSHVGKSFFWDSDHGGGFEANKPPRDNFTTALSLDPNQVKPEYRAGLWLAFKGLLDTRTASTYSDKPGTICLPGKGKPVDKAAAEKTAARFDTDPWYGMIYAVGVPVAVRDAPKSTAPIVGQIDNEAVIVQHELRTDPDATWEPVHLANAVKGWVQSQQVSTFLNAQLCFARGRNKTWKIVGYNGGGD